MRPLATTLLICLLSFSLPAFSAYKCESNGKISYKDQPCPYEKQAELAARITVTEQDAALARQQAMREKTEVRRLEKERRKREAAEEKQAKLTAHSAAVKKSKCDALAQRLRWSEEDAAHAVGKATDKAKRRARRMAESYRMQCS